MYFALPEAPALLMSVSTKESKLLTLNSPVKLYFLAKLLNSSSLSLLVNKYLAYSIARLLPIKSIEYGII